MSIARLADRACQKLVQMNSSELRALVLEVDSVALPRAPSVSRSRIMTEQSPKRRRLSLEPEQPSLVLNAGPSTTRIDDVPDPSAAVVEDTAFELAFTHAGKPYQIVVHSTDSVLDLKAAIWSVCSVPIERQKILGLVKSKLPPDDALVATLALERRVGSKPFTVLGTPTGEELQGGIADVLDDWDVDPKQIALKNPQHDARNQRRIREAVKKLEVNVINEPRPGKRCLVLDLDYTVRSILRRISDASRSWVSSVVAEL